MLVAVVTVPTVLSLAVPLALIWLAIWGGLAWRISLGMSLMMVVAGGCVLSHYSEQYFRLRDWEVSGTLYEHLGVRYFKRFVVTGDYWNRAARYYDHNHRGLGSAKSIRQAKRQREFSEKVHLLALFSTLPPIICAMLIGWSKAAALLALSNLPFNVYPVMLQRYTRARIESLMNHRRPQRAPQTRYA